MRSPLVVTSVGFHIVVVAGFLVAGLWKLERLDPERRRVDIAVSPPPPPAPSGSPAAAPHVAFTKKQPRTITKALVQPTEGETDTPPAATSATDTGGTGGTGSGAGSGSGTDPAGTGTCTEEPCGPGDPQPSRAPQPPEVERPVLVPPAVIKGLRIAGETQVHPPALVKTAILRDGKNKLVATYRVCVGTDGTVDAVSALKSSGYAGYDSAIDSALRTWRYRPYEIGGRRAPVCGVVTFIYTLQ